MAEVTPILDKDDVETSGPTIARASEIKDRAEEIKKKRELPPAPGPNVTLREMQAWLKLLHKDNEERITIWLYRFEPIIDRAQVDPEADNNIEIFYSDFDKITEDYIKEIHGGGSYKFVVKDGDKPRTTKGGFFESRLYVPMLDCPPKLDLREVVWDNPKNKGYKSWARSKGLIDERNMPVTMESKQSNQSQNGNADIPVIMKTMLDFVTKMTQDQQVQLKKQLGAEDSLGKSIGDILLEKMKQEDPNKQLQTFTTLLAAMKGNTPQPVDTMSTMIPFFVQMMQSQQAASDKQFQLMMELLKENKKGGGEETSKIDELKALLEVAKEIKGGNSNSSKSTAEVVGEIFTTSLGPALNIINNIVALRANQSIPQSPNSNVRQMPTNNVDRMNEQNKANVTTPTSLPEGTEDMTINEATIALKQFGPLIYPKLGDDGWKFGVAVANMFGDPIAAKLANFGVEGLLQAAKQVPEFWNEVNSTYGEAHFKKWLESLVDFREQARKYEEEEMEYEDEVEDKT